MSAVAVAHSSTQRRAPNAPRKRSQYKCGHCKRPGHNRQTCPMKNVVTERGTSTVARKLEYSFIKEEIKTDLACVHKEEEEEEEEELCPICFESFCDDDTTSKPSCELECKHKFHTSCIFTWLSKKTSCPMCRADVPELKQPSELSIPPPELMYAFIRNLNAEELQRAAPDPGAIEHLLGGPRYGAWTNVYERIYLRLRNLSSDDYRHIHESLFN
jgi:hypothetical protein